MLIKGAEVAAKIDEQTKNDAKALADAGHPAMLAVVRVGEKPDDIYYEASAVKRAEKLGVLSKRVTLDADAAQSEIENAVRDCSQDSAVSGILLLRPLPKDIDEDAVIRLIDPKKDVDGITRGSLASVFAGRGEGFAPCTPEACMRILEHYGVELSGKKVTVVGRSLVVGKPLSMLLLGRNATVTICHSRTKDLKSVCREADVLIAAVGRANMIDADYVKEGQVVVDVGINADENGKMVGDVSRDSVEGVVSMLTPVPGGVGTVTTSVLLSNTVCAAETILKENIR